MASISFVSGMPLQVSELVRGFRNWEVQPVVMLVAEMGIQQIGIAQKDRIAVYELIQAWNCHAEKLQKQGRGRDLYFWNFEMSTLALSIRNQNKMTLPAILGADRQLGVFLRNLPRGFSLREC